MAVIQLIYLVLIGTVCLHSSVVASPLQHPLELPQSHTGVLRRFNTNLDLVLRTAAENDLDIWQVTDSHVDIYSPLQAPHLPQALLQLPHSDSFIHPDPLFQSTLPLAKKVKEWGLDSLENTTFHSNYHPLYEIDTFLKELNAAYSNITRISYIGHSAQGREMYAFTISSDGFEAKRRKERKRDSDAKHGFVILGAQHAREWIATAASLYLAHALVVSSTEPHALSSLVDHFDFHIIPVPNPDGYDYTWETDRFWYKNRQVVSPKARCVGIDMNRNWGYKWKPVAIGMSQLLNNVSEPHTPLREPTDPCSVWYPGHRPFEAPEVNNVANFITTLPNLVGFIDLRSYGQMLSSPYSYTCKKLSKDAEDQIEAALGATQALKMVHGTAFKTGSLCSMLYKAPGNVVDWMYARAKVKYSYVAHLRDTGTYGFSLPESWIRPVGEETGNMVHYIATFIKKKLKLDPL